MTTTLLVVLVIAVLAAAMWIVRLHAERARLAAGRDLAQQRLADAQQNEARQRETFQALAGEALQQSSAQLLQLAEQKFAAQQAQAAGELDKRRTAVEQLMQPIGKALEKTQEELRRLETERVNAYAGLRQQVLAIAQTNEQLRGETSRLVQALSKPNVRGRYGEIQLQRVAELAGMQPYCDFAVQESVRDSDGRLLKPDMVVRLPNERVIAVDAKTNIGAYLEALDAKGPEQAEACLKRFADHVAEQAQALGRKGYWKQFDSAEFVVMFVPGDQFIDAALERRPDLIELAARSNVVLASPSTLIGLLRAVNLGWREKRFSESARQLQDLGRQLLERFNVALGHAERVGQALGKARDSYNEFVGSVDSRVVPQLRRFEEAGVSAKEPIVELTPVEGVVRTLASAPVERALPEATPSKDA